jgi:hypothetical protein
MMKLVFDSSGKKSVTVSMTSVTIQCKTWHGFHQQCDPTCINQTTDSKASIPSYRFAM